MSKSTLKYIGKRLLIALVTLFVIIAILFFMLKLMPGSPFNSEKLTPDQMAAVFEKYGLDQPIHIQFINYFKNMISGDFGISYSISKNASVAELVVPRAIISFSIGIIAVIFGTVIGIILGVFAALNRNTIWDTISTILSVLGVSIPSFVFALLLLMLFGVKIPVLPIIYNSRQPILSSIIPMLALSGSVIANVARFTRSEMIEVLGSEYMLLAEAKGINRKMLIFDHALRNTLIPVITVLAPIMISLITGSMVIEKICGIPGLGTLLVKAIEVNDYNVIMAVAFLYSLLYIGMMLIVDVSYGVIDPRIRLTKGENNG
ncbi:ABC transporter permease [Erysipelothrix sp. HDW6A]|uniref:ABC transporter permease n=1 Tax=Erysipelothrix sp. HDW6A TaxID=2714928 RepID=UPI00140B5C5D|nr:ABC transporter permease [Erysipelothrix sp. HDW6A]QIK57908.1 ABC transporter permease [Erysipelothrix sp. HDW6A]